jgi:hypothetical protein
LAASSRVQASADDGGDVSNRYALIDDLVKSV